MKVDFMKKLADIAPVIEGLLTACSLVTQSNKLTMAIGVAKMAKVINTQNLLNKTFFR